MSPNFPFIPMSITANIPLVLIVITSCPFFLPLGLYMYIPKCPLPGLQEFIYSTDFMIGGGIQRLKKPSPYPQITHSIMKKNMTNKSLVRLAGSAINIYKGMAMVKCLTLCNQSLSPILSITQRGKSH